ncbi:MAG: protein translocase subunit SecD [Anaerolineae bacterium]|nr:protein translocase subunit SecD [Anaerolineae bacterium]
MRSSSTTPWLVFIAAVAILVIYMIWPSWPGGVHPGLFGRALEVRPGLDIQGGLRVLLTAESAEPVTAEQMSEVRRVIERRVNALGVAEPVVQLAGSNRVIVELPGISDPQTAIDLVQQTALLEFVDFARTGACTASMPVAGQYVLTDRNQVLQVNSGGTATATQTGEATIAATATNTAAATTEATSAATADATLEPTVASIVRIDDAVNAQQGTAEATAAATAQATATTPATATPAATADATAAATAEATAAATTEATAEATTAPVTGDPGTKTNPLKNPCTGQPFRTVMTGAGLQTAEAGLQSQGATSYVVNFTLSTNEEGQKFVSHTQSNIGQPMAIVLDGEILSAPTIQNAITSTGTITGNFTREDAINLAVQLRSGALPVSLRIESTEQVGASLGSQSVQQSIRAGIVGVLAVFLFMLIYYRLAGFAAVLALLLFAGINFALYKYIPVTLTLSAITGFLISIGTAVDGNILIFERIKEEKRQGKGNLKAIESGFTRAWPSIRESNISTILIALILYFFGGQFGASAVRGFAITLIIGLVINLFTAVIVTRTFLSLFVNLRGDRADQVKLFGDQ